MTCLRGAAPRHATRVAVLAAVLALLLPRDAFAQSGCTLPVAPAGESWSPPLSKPVTLHAGRLPLRDALDRLAAAGGFRLTYSADLLPLERTVCLDHDGAAAGLVLTHLLAGVAVRPVVAGSDHVVLAPAEAPPEAAAPAADTMLSVYPLRPVIVTASSAAPARGRQTFAMDVLDGRDLARWSNGSVAQALNGTVAGVWVWPGTGAGLPAHFGSLRGASSFGLSTPKVYIDGIEVANPLLLGRLPVDAIDRIEVIRGPQGAALYGSDALNGVTHIITRHDPLTAGAPRMRFRSTFGLSDSDFASTSTFGQDHAFGLQFGTRTRSAAINVAAGTSGEFIPDGAAHHLSADGSLRLLGQRNSLTGTFRFHTQEAGDPISPMIPDSLLALTPVGAMRPAAGVVSMQQYTAGLRFAFAGSDGWSHSILAGVDGYALSGVTDRSRGVASPVDSALRAAGTGAIRGTLRLSSTATLDLGRKAEGALTFSAEHTLLRQTAEAESDTWSHAALPATAVLRPADAQDGRRTQSATRGNTGFTAQATVDLFDQLNLSGGVRFERVHGGVGSDPFATLPMVSGAWRTDAGPFGLALRAAYGKGVRWPDLPPPSGNPRDLYERALRLSLGPEQQSGIEAGLDLTYGSALTIRLTRFDQTASGLVQAVTVVSATPLLTGPGHVLWSRSEYQNVGEIANQGWELQATTRRGPLSLTGSLSLVDSRVQNLAAGYTGDLREGDRMLAVPARTFGLAAEWTAARWAASLAVRRAADWINYDRIALAQAHAEGNDPAGPELREFWRSYNGMTRLRAGVSREIRRGLTLVLTGENLLNYQVGEPDNITVLPGRTFSLGLRATF